MIDQDWSQQELQLDILKRQAERYLTTFRWLWLFNLVAAIFGVVTHQYYLTVVAALSSGIAFIGVALARRGCKIVSEATAECHNIQQKIDEPESEPVQE